MAFVVDREALALIILLAVCAGNALLFAGITVVSYRKKQYFFALLGTVLVTVSTAMGWLFLAPLIGIHYNL